MHTDEDLVHLALSQSLIMDFGRCRYWERFGTYDIGVSFLLQVSRVYEEAIHRSHR